MLMQADCSVMDSFLAALCALVGAVIGGAIGYGLGRRSLTRSPDSGKRWWER